MSGVASTRMGSARRCGGVISAVTAMDCECFNPGASSLIGLLDVTGRPSTAGAGGSAYRILEAAGDPLRHPADEETRAREQLRDRLPGDHLG
jgi:hypothetical protein